MGAPTSAGAISPVLLDENCEALRVKVSVAFMLSGALEVQTRLAREVDPELHRLIGAAHAHALHVMARDRVRLRDVRRAVAERQQREGTTA